jgi:hypothetical protein
MRYDYHTYTRYRRRIKPEQDIRINELKKVISIVKSRLDYQHTLDMYVKPVDDVEATFWNRGFDAACNSIITLLEAVILDYEGKL